MKHLLVICAFTYCFISQSFDCAAKGPAKQASGSNQFSRADFMMLNLNRGEDSTGSHISLALKQTRQMIKDLEKSQCQMEQVDKEFAKSKGRPDDRFLTATSSRLNQALKTARELELQLFASKDELKDSIQQSLITAP